MLQVRYNAFDERAVQAVMEHEDLSELDPGTSALQRPSQPPQDGDQASDLLLPGFVLTKTPGCCPLWNVQPCCTHLLRAAYMWLSGSGVTLP